LLLSYISQKVSDEGPTSLEYSDFPFPKKKSILSAKSVLSPLGCERRSIWVSIYIDPDWEGKVRARREKIVSVAFGETEFLPLSDALSPRKLRPGALPSAFCGWFVYAMIVALRGRGFAGPQECCGKA
jgi:hypothetical protein